MSAPFSPAPNHTANDNKQTLFSSAVYRMCTACVPPVYRLQDAKLSSLEDIMKAKEAAVSSARGIAWL